MRPVRSTRRVGGATLLGVALAAIGALLAAGSLTACEPVVPDTYVAIGDSGAAGPLILPQVTGDDIGCLRSTNNYPSLARPKIKVARFVDRTCSGAQTDAYWHTQTFVPGTNPRPPQRDSIDARTKVVTVQLGANDLSFTALIEACVRFNPFDTGCTSTFLKDGHDVEAERIRNVIAPSVDALLADIKARAPQAKVFVVGYLAALPETGNGCWSLSVPVLPADLPYLRSVGRSMNRMLKERAEAAGATFVDAYQASMGHDVCAADRWTEPLFPSTDAAPVHPNLAGMKAVAALVAAKVNAQVTS